MLSLPLYIDADVLATGNPHYLRDLRDLLDAYLRVQSHQTTQRKMVRQEVAIQESLKSSTGKKTSPPGPAVGERAIDYLLHALVAADGRLLRTEVLSAVYALGWTTKAQTKNRAMNTLRAALDSSSELIESDGDTLILTESGRAFVQTLPSLPSVSNATTEAP